MANRVTAKKTIDSELIKTKMKELGFTNKDLAEKLKINEKTLSRWLKSGAIPIDKMPDLARELFMRYEMTTDNAIAVLRRMQEPDPFEPQITQTAFDALEMAIEAIQKYATWSQTYSNMVEDAISRQAAIEAFKKELTIGESKGNYVTLCSAVSYEGAKQILESLPSAQPEKVCIANITLSEEQIREAVEKAKEELKNSPILIEPEQQWIPCSERLPHYSETVIVSILDDTGDYNLNYTDVGWITHDGTWIVDNDENNMVTAWMPLPESYKEK